MKIKRLLTATALLTLFAAGAWADSSTGTIGVTLTLTNGCLINNSPNKADIDFGTLDFGDQPATFTTLTQQMNSFSIKWNTAYYTVKVTGSKNTAQPATVAGTAGSPARYLVNGADATQGVAYSLYDNSGMQNEIANGDTLEKISTADGTDTYAVWGKIVGNGTLVSAGTYTDTVQVSVDY